MLVRDLRDLLAGLDPDALVCVPGPGRSFVPVSHARPCAEDEFVASLTGRGPLVLLVPSARDPATGWAWREDSA